MSNGALTPVIHRASNGESIPGPVILNVTPSESEHSSHLLVPFVMRLEKSLVCDTRVDGLHYPCCVSVHRDAMVREPEYP